MAERARVRRVERTVQRPWRYLVWLGLLAVGSMAGCRQPPADYPDAAITAVLAGPLFQSVEGRRIDDGIVVMAGDRVACSGRRRECPVPDGVPVQAVEGTILPGLIDLHTHARPAYIGAFLPAGVTTIRDANNTLTVVDSLKAAPGGPRVLASGPLLDGPSSTMRGMSPTAGELGDHPVDELVPVLVEDGPAAAEAVHVLSGSGVDFIKLYQRLPVDAFHGAVQAAGERRLPIAVDLGMAFTGGLRGSEVDIVDAAEAGVRSLEHLSGLALAYQRRGGDPLNPPYDSAILDAIADELLRTGAAAVPTVATFVRLSDPDALPPEKAPGAELGPYFAPQWQGLAAMASRAADAVEADRELTGALLRRLHDGGMVIGAGSDLPAAPGMVPGGALHLELEALVAAGLTPVQALQAATWNAARILGRDDLGHLGAGAHADVLVVRGDPTRDITATREIRGVWSAGNEVDLEDAWRRTEAALAPPASGSDEGGADRTTSSPRSRERSSPGPTTDYPER